MRQQMDRGFLRFLDNWTESARRFEEALVRRETSGADLAKCASTLIATHSTATLDCSDRDGEVDE
jgi:hypothetical protein